MNDHSQRPPDPAAALAPTEAVVQRIVVRDMTVGCMIGFLAEERARRQRLRINLEIDLVPAASFSDEIADTLNYSVVVRAVRERCARSRYRLLETLAEDLAATCFAQANVIRTRIRIEKLDRYPEVGGIGVEIERRRTRP